MTVKTNILGVDVVMTPTTTDLNDSDFRAKVEAEVAKLYKQHFGVECPD